MSVHVLVVGAGGNIGSHLVPHLSRMSAVGRVSLVDPDVYEAGNLEHQALLPADLGCAKARVQARRLRRIRPDLDVSAVVQHVEALPLGRLRADLILACLDSRRSRQRVNEAARRLGVPWIDAGVQADGRLARIDVYLPGDTEACLECSWDPADYALVEQRYPCPGGRAVAPATRAPAALGALAAALQALECERLLAGAAGALAAGGQVVLDARHHVLHRSHFRRNVDCRLSPHGCWDVRPLVGDPRTLTIGALLERERAESLSVFGQELAERVRCGVCQRSRPVRRLARAIPRRCRCGGELTTTGFDRVERVGVDDAAWSGLSLARLRLLPGDVLTLRHAGARATRLEIGDEAA